MEGDSITISQKPFFDGNQIPLKPEWYSSNGNILPNKSVSDSMRAFLKLCDSTIPKESVNDEDIPVDYPRHPSDGMIYTWFSKNRTTNRNHPYPMTLPHPLLDSSQKLPLRPELSPEPEHVDTTVQEEQKREVNEQDVNIAVRLMDMKGKPFSGTITKIEQGIATIDGIPVRIPNKAGWLVHDIVTVDKWEFDFRSAQVTAKKFKLTKG